MRAVLDEPQLVRLRALDELSARRNILENATFFGLSPTDCSAPQGGYMSPVCEGPFIPSVSRIPEWGPRPEDPLFENDAFILNRRLEKYLGLTALQLERMMENQKMFHSRSELSRMSAVADEIRQETARDTLDPFALGLRYAEVEALRRKMFEDTQMTIAANVKLLTPIQRVKLDALSEAMQLQPTVQEARWAYIMGSRCREVGGYAFFNKDASPNFEGFSAYLGDCPDKRALEELP
jgi:hypothetical protein